MLDDVRMRQPVQSALPVPADVPPAQVAALRAFNRFWTRRIGVLEPAEGGVTLAELRVLYELAQGEAATAGALARALGMDAGFLSRVLRRLRERGWLASTPVAGDARQALLQLTRDGQAAFAPLQARSQAQAAALLAPLGPTERDRALGAMQALRELLGEMPAPPRARAAVLRDPRPGDGGWVVQQHGEIYAREHGYDSRFEALVAEVVAKMLRGWDPAWEKGWIAELDGERVGSVFVVRKAATVAQLRLLILAPRARGLGLGGRLVDEAVAFARERGYRRLVLWTNGQLDAARAIYAARGFACVASEPLHDYGRALTGETWELKLR